MSTLSSMKCRDHCGYDVNQTSFLKIIYKKILNSKFLNKKIYIDLHRLFKHYFLCFLFPVMVRFIFFTTVPSSGIFFSAFLTFLGITSGCTMRPARKRISGTEVALTTLEEFHSAIK